MTTLTTTQTQTQTLEESYTLGLSLDDTSHHQRRSSLKSGSATDTTTTKTTNNSMTVTVGGDQTRQEQEDQQQQEPTQISDRGSTEEGSRDTKPIATTTPASASTQQKEREQEKEQKRPIHPRPPTIVSATAQGRASDSESGGGINHENSISRVVSRSPRDTDRNNEADKAMRTGTRSDGTAALEERVQELEAKLSTLSLLLSQQRIRSLSPPSITPPVSPPTDTFNMAMNGNGMDLESPAPMRPSVLQAYPSRSYRDRRNLSFRVLHADSPSSRRLSLLQGEDEDSTAETLLRNGELPTIYLPENLSSLEVEAAQAATTKSGDDNNTARRQSSASTSAPTSPHSTQITPEKHETSKSVTISDEKATTVKQQDDNSDNVTNTDIKSKWLDYLNSVQESNYDTDKQMEEFIKVPSAVEALLNFGFWICVDSFLYTLTILPLRFVWSCLLFVRYLIVRIILRKTLAEGPFRFHRWHSYQMIQVGIIYTVYKYALLPISIGKLYHWIRGQNMVKLYLLIAIVEVFDRLMCSLGQDCLDSLYWNTTRRPRSSRLIVSVVVVLSYAVMHSFLLFVHVATLNVAMNSDDQALLSLLIGGNFAEIKSTVFKKYNKANLFKITASDICERFKLALFLTLVLTLNVSQGMDKSMIMNYIHMCLIVWGAEWVSDWIKHSFITKFNYISSRVYPEYGLLLAGDVTGLGHEGVNLDHSHAVVKRLGLAQMPLVCVMARYIREAYKYTTYESPPSNWLICIGFISIWSSLFLFKVVLGYFLHRICHVKLRAAPEFSSKNTSVAKKEKK